MAKSVSNLLGIAIFCCLAATAQVQPGQCGYDRWPVKILNDKDRARIDFHAIDTTVATLGAIPIHEVPYPYDHRVAPEELRVYRLRVRFLRLRHEADSDIHLLLADLDQPEKRMIAEIPAPQCAEGTGHEQEYETARKTISSIPPNTVIEIIGVGFFDFIHEQRGAAKNGIELHPVLFLHASK
jgi:hypothetical protein